MAKFELKFIDAINDNEFIKVECVDKNDDGNEKVISITGDYDGGDFIIFLDKSTAIKFAKTLRTEINKITENELPTFKKGNLTTLTGIPKKGEVNNG